jgi:large subunit ribosomal protein L27
MAKKKAAGAVKKTKDSNPKMRGVKAFGNHKVRPGQILVRQVGTAFHPGTNVKRASDDSLISLVDGTVTFTKRKVRAFNGNLTNRRFVSVIAAD